MSIDVAVTLDRMDQHERLAAACRPPHLADGPPVEPEPDYTPRHLRRTTDV